MKIDPASFQEVFFEEAREALGVMEAGLLALTADTPREAIDDIFRAAHSVKGSSGIFGFTEITQFTHFIETLLDQMRVGERAASEAVTGVLLEAVDALGDLVEARKSGRPAGNAAGEVSRKLEAVLAEPRAGAAMSPEAALAALSARSQTGSGPWRIGFRPHRDFFRTGNEPQRLVRELRQLGELRVEADVSAVPELGDLEPGDCYLAWSFELPAETPEAGIRGVFDWVELDGDLTIERRALPGPAGEGEAAAAALVEPPAETEAARAGKPEANAMAPAEDRRRSETASLRVSTEKVDAIINLVGELVITQSMLNRFGEQFDLSQMDRLRDGLALLERNTRELQETVLKIRMLPINFCFQRFPRLVRDLGAALGKQVKLRLSGEQTELDKTVLERISDPLVHLVRNAIDHGLEKPEVRRAAGKPEEGTLHLHAAHEGGSVIIEITDDGAGLDRARILAKGRSLGLVGEDEQLSNERIDELIFAPGFSTAAAVTDISGRGVGMDVVRRNIKDLGGGIEIQSEPGEGTRFLIRLPLTLAILDGQLIQVGDQTFVIPLVSIVESLQVRRELVHGVAGGGELYRLRDEYLPVLRLDRLFGLTSPSKALEDGLLVVIEADGQKAALLVDDLLAQQQVVIKSLETNFRRVEGLSGATILGDGTVAMILDVGGIVAMSRPAPLLAAALAEGGAR